MNFKDLLTKATWTAYPEPDSPLHSDIIDNASKMFTQFCKPPARVLDIGCGSCYGAKALRNVGYEVTPISVLQAEVDEARALGFPAMKCEMNETDLLGKFDAVWLRHAAEHSPCPLLLLTQLSEQADWLYLEIPLPETDAHHETNPNHYSCLTELGWVNIIRSSGWEIVTARAIPLKLVCGDDAYIFYVCKKLKTGLKE